MKKIYLFGILASLVIFSAMTFVYAHSEISSQVETGQENFDVEEINEMHEEMMEEITDPETIKFMNSMHKDCIQNER